MPQTHCFEFIFSLLACSCSLDHRLNHLCKLVLKLHTDTHTYIHTGRLHIVLTQLNYACVHKEANKMCSGCERWLSHTVTTIDKCPTAQTRSVCQGLTLSNLLLLFQEITSLFFNTVQRLGQVLEAPTLQGLQLGLETAHICFCSLQF